MVLDDLDEKAIAQGNRIKELRKQTHLSRRAFAIKHNISSGTLQNCEDGRYKGLTNKTALKLVKAFEAEGLVCTLNWLLKGIEEKVENTSEKESETLNNVNLLKQAQKNQELHQSNFQLFHAVLDGRYSEVIKLIESGNEVHLKEGMDIKIYNALHNTPLHIASLNGYVEIIKYLLKKHVNINSKNRKGETALHLAVHNGHKEIVKQLITHHIFINEIDSEGDTALAWAAYRGHIEIVRLLIERGAIINIKNNLGNTPLHWAATKGFVDIVKTLVDHNADLNAKDCDGMTPLKKAIQYGQVESVKYLICL